MPFDGSGNYLPPSAPAFPAISGTPISSTYYNTVINDISTALNNVLTRDGQGKPSAAISWNGKDLTNILNLSAVNGAFSGTLTATGAFTAGSITGTPIFFTPGSVKTIASGAIAVAAGDNYFSVDTEGAAATDDLTSITGGTTGQFIIFRGVDAGRVITIKSSGNINVPQDIILSDASKGASFIYDGVLSEWTAIALPYSVFTSTQIGLTPASAGGTSNFLRADGTWNAPAPTSLNALTMNNSGAGNASGATFDGSVVKTISYNTIGAVPAGLLTASGLTMTTAKLLGRTTASTGAIEEISAGATLTLASGSLGVASVPAAATFSNAGSGVASGTTYNGATARTVSWNSVGAQPSAPRVQAVTSSATVTPDGDDDDIVTITAQAATLTLAAPSGSATQGKGLVIRIKDNGTARTINWNAIYRAVGVTLPLTTVISKTVYIGVIYNSTDTKWDAVSVAQEA